MKLINPPLVTVVTLVYNTNKFAIEALESIKNQSYTNIEHIIIDDYSKDDSAEIVDKWIKNNNWNCVYLKNTSNMGIPHNLNKALFLAKGKYFCGIADDLWMKDHIKTNIELFELIPEDIAVLYSDYATIDEKGLILKDSHRDKVKNLNSYDSQFQFKELLKGNFICAATAIMRTSALMKVGGYDENRRAEDIPMWLNLTQNNYRIHFIPDKTTFYRIRQGSITNQSKGKGSVEPLIFYSKYLGLNREIDKILAPRFYYWTKRLVKYNKDYRLHWPLKTFYLNRNFQSFNLLLYCVLKKIVTSNE